MATYLVCQGDQGESALDGRELGPGVGEALEVGDDGLRCRWHLLLAMQVAPHYEVVPVDAVRLPRVFHLGVEGIAADVGGQEHSRLPDAGHRHRWFDHGVLSGRSGAG